MRVARSSTSANQLPGVTFPLPRNQQLPSRKRWIELCNLTSLVPERHMQIFTMFSIEKPRSGSHDFRDSKSCLPSSIHRCLHCKACLSTSEPLVLLNKSRILDLREYPIVISWLACLLQNSNANAENITNAYSSSSLSESATTILFSPRALTGRISSSDSSFSSSSIYVAMASSSSLPS